MAVWVGARDAVLVLVGPLVQVGVRDGVGVEVRGSLNRVEIGLWLCLVDHTKVVIQAATTTRIKAIRRKGSRRDIIKLISWLTTGTRAAIAEIARDW